ncbi:MAG TPA: protein kinase [Ktedonobacterales bacterium]
MNPQEDTLGATWLASRYQVAGLRARGALCLVYQGQDAVLQRPVVIKAPLHAHVDAYREALATTSTLTHPAFLALYDVIEQGDGVFLAYEFVEGRPLADYIVSGLPMRRALAVVLQVVRALAYAHAHGVVHGDLTPAAILLDRSASARVTNLGLPPDDLYFDETASLLYASGVADDPDTTAATLTERPERLDTWAAAAILWRLVTDPTSEAEGESEKRSYRTDAPETLRTGLERVLRVTHSNPILSSAALGEVLTTLEADFESANEGLEEPTPAAVVALRAARQRASAAMRRVTGAPDMRWKDTGEQVVSPTATTSYGVTGHDAAVVHDRSITQPSHEGAHGDEERFAARAPFLSLPARPSDDPAPRFRVATDARERALVPAAERGHGLGSWVWALISLAVFALCFLVGFLLAGMLPLARFP